MSALGAVKIDGSWNCPLCKRMLEWWAFEGKNDVVLGSMKQPWEVDEFYGWCRGCFKRIVGLCELEEEVVDEVKGIVRERIVYHFEVAEGQESRSEKYCTDDVDQAGKEWKAQASFMDQSMKGDLRMLSGALANQIDADIHASLALDRRCEELIIKMKIDEVEGLINLAIDT